MVVDPGASPPDPHAFGGTGFFHMPRHHSHFGTPQKKHAMCPPRLTRVHTVTRKPPMAFTARLLAPWDPVFVKFNAVDEYDAWMTKIGGEPLKSTTVEQLRVWTTTAKAFDTLWLNDESDQCPAENAEIQLMRNG